MAQKRLKSYKTAYLAAPPLRRLQGFNPALQARQVCQEQQALLDLLEQARLVRLDLVLQALLARLVLLVLRVEIGRAHV